jgi:CheY-like chemotaxis protein
MKTDGETDEPLKVMIVEDEMFLAMDLEAHLTTLGQKVVGTASDAKEAFDLADAAAPDLALVDLNLRDGLTGPQIASELARNRAALVVFVTGSPEQIPADYAGAVGAITKPWDSKTLEQLVIFVRSHLSTPRGSAGAPAMMMMAPSQRTNDDVALAIPL